MQDRAQLPAYEVHALCHASMDRNPGANFIVKDAHGGPMPMDCFVWLLKSPHGHILANPFPIGYNVADMLEGCLRHADFPDHVVPRQDPLVLERYPAFPHPECRIACLHEASLAGGGAH